MNTILVIDVDKEDLSNLDTDALKARYLHIRKILSECDVQADEVTKIHDELDRVLIEINSRLSTPGPL